MFNSFQLALVFLTRFPIRVSSSTTPRERDEALLFYPLVGLLIGGLLWLVASWSGSTIALFASVVVVALWVLVSGALHLDGLADCADAWVGGLGDRQRTMRIMKDPNAGPLAIVILILVLLVKTVAIAELIASGWQVALLVIPVLGRSASIALFLTTPYVSPGGLGEIHANQVEAGDDTERVNKRQYVLAASGIFSVVVLGWTGVVLLLMLFLVFFVIRKMAMNRLGGFTGDVAGAMIELIEAASCVILVYLI